MARLTRKINKLFCENAQQADVGQFGSLNAGTKIQTTDVDTIQALSAWGGGWKAATLGDNCYPTRQERNGLDYVQYYLLNYLYQEGIPEWDNNTTYYTGSLVKLINGVNVQIYQSLVDNNTAALSDTNSWLAWDFANRDLANLTNTGLNNLANYVYELDFDNIISVSTVNDTNYKTFTPTKNGLFISDVRATGGVNVSKTISHSISINSVILQDTRANAYYNTQCVDVISAVVRAGETVTYYGYAQNGTSHNTAVATFIPFKNL